MTQETTQGNPSDRPAAGPVATIGFVGIGRMGWPMAANLVRAGYRLSVLDRDQARAGKFAAEFASARAAPDAAACAADADLIITMLPDGDRVNQSVLGTVGLLASLRPGTIVIDMSSSDPIGTRELGAALLVREVTLIDAPVSGLVPRAENGRLTIMIGADADDAVARAMPVLERLGERIFRVGALGCGHALKALNNVVSATVLTATAEALIVGKRFGLDPAVMLDVLNVSSGRSFHTDVTLPDQVLTRQFGSGFRLELMAKDVDIAASLASEVSANAPLLALAGELWRDGRDQIGAAEDHTAIIRHWEQLNDVILGSV